MSQSNIDKFDEITGRIFANLYETFPQPITINFEEYTTSLATSNDPVDGVIHNYFERQFVSDSVVWLRDSGYITSVSNDEYSIHGTILTAKGLECLKKVPASLDPRPSFGSQLVEAVRGGSLDAVKTLSSTVITAGAALTSQHLGFR
ncbi:hypothetical protein [Enterobacter roggenkampii]